MTDTSGPPVVRNPVSIAGAWLTTLAAFAFLGYLAAEASACSKARTRACWALWRAGDVRRRPPADPVRDVARRAPPQAGNAAWKWPAVDLQLRRSRIIAAAVVFLTLVNVVVVAVAGLGVTHYMESPCVLRAGLPRADAAGVRSTSGLVAQQSELRAVSRRAGRARHHQGQDERHPADVPVRDQFT